MGKRTASLALIATLAAGFIAISAPAATALSSAESCFYNAMNRERAAAGRAKLSLASDLTSSARRHSARMADRGTIYHNNNLPNEISGGWTALGENVGMGPTCDSIHDAFMNSPGHRANILDRDYNQVGVGVVVSDDTIYVTEVFAGRRTSTTTTVRPRTTTTTTTRTVSTKPATTRRVTARPKPAAKPAPKPVLQAAPRTVGLLIQLVGMDAQQVDPATGAAMGV